jgi:hypothetical protein
LEELITNYYLLPNIEAQYYCNILLNTSDVKY